MATFITDNRAIFQLEITNAVSIGQKLDEWFGQCIAELLQEDCQSAGWVYNVLFLVFLLLIKQIIMYIACFSVSGVKENFLPPRPSLTRYGKETTSIKTFTKKKLAESKTLDERSSYLKLLTVSQLCVRLNTLHVRLADIFL